MAHLLIVDDDPILRQLLAHKLTIRGHTIESAADGEAALSRVHHKRPDGVILDIMMPGMGGLAVLDQIKGDPRTAATTVMILSARREEADIVDAIARGADDYVTKPFLPNELGVRLERFLAARRRSA